MYCVIPLVGSAAVIPLKDVADVIIPKSRLASEVYFTVIYDICATY